MAEMNTTEKNSENYDIEPLSTGSSEELLSSSNYAYYTGLSFGVSSEESLPFWMTTNKNGLIPNHNYGMWDFGVKKLFDEDKKTDWVFGLKAAASVASEADIRFQDYYLGAKWGKLQIHAGAKADAVRYDGLSSTNGSFIMSNNARPYPRVVIELPDYLDIPFTNGWLSFKGLYSEGVQIDDRYVEKPRVHYKNLYVRLGGEEQKLNFEIGLNHYAQWAGTSEQYGKLPSSFDAYMDLILAKDNSEYDQLGSELDHNRVGNHIGMYDMKLTYNAQKSTWSAYRQIIFEDSSGGNLFNRDALMGLYVSRKKEGAPWVKSLLLEYYTTEYQSGKEIGAKPDGGIYTGQDNYFNNGIYRSGWTSYGYTIGTPFFTPAIAADGQARGVSNNRLTAFHGGLSGNFAKKLPYKVMLSYTQNQGTYRTPIDENQVSAYLEMLVPQTKIPFDLSFGVAADRGGYLEDNFGAFVKISTAGLF